MGIIQITKCNVCGTEEREPSQLAAWVQMANSFAGPNITPTTDQWSFCPNCWVPGFDIYDLYMNNPTVINQRAAMMQAEMLREERIAAAEEGMLATHDAGPDIHTDYGADENLEDS